MLFKFLGNVFLLVWKIQSVENSATVCLNPCRFHVLTVACYSGGVFVHIPFCNLSEYWKIKTLQ